MYTLIVVSDGSRCKGANRWEQDARPHPGTVHGDFSLGLGGSRQSFFILQNGKKRTAGLCFYLLTRSMSLSSLNFRISLLDAVRQHRWASDIWNNGIVFLLRCLCVHDKDSGGRKRAVQRQSEMGWPCHSMLGK